jgi:hypothetical protein
MGMRADKNSVIKADAKLIAACGLYCGACGAFLKGKCPGCKENVKAEKWCNVKNCCKDNGYKSCADCGTYKNPDDCKNFNNFISKIFKVIFRSNRKGCIDKIRSVGYDEFAKEMSKTGNYNGKGL